jgi:hypothetical protein
VAARGIWFPHMADIFYVFSGISNIWIYKDHDENSFDIEKRVRATFHQLPYKQLTKTMTTMLVMDSAKKSTSFLQSMEYYHTKALEWFSIENLGCKKNCKHTFGVFIQANNKPNPKNDNSLWTLDCIYFQIRDSQLEDTLADVQLHQIN